MQRNTSNLIGNILVAADGEIGTVKDFYFDEHSWTVRYLVVKTGGWLFGRIVLISPYAVLPHSWESGVFPVRLTKEQVRLSPDIDTENPISREQEEELVNHYSWQKYWRKGFYPGEREILKEPIDTGHLRSAQKITTCDIYASDGDIGNVCDIIMDDQNWQITYLVANLHNWIGGKKVLIAATTIKVVNWERSKVMVNITMLAIKNSSAIDPWNYIIPESGKALSHSLS
jgi:hypothetical protein